MKAFIFCLSLFILGSQALHAQGLQVAIRGVRNDVSDYTLVGRADRMLRVMPKGKGSGEMLLNVKDIVEVRFALPPALTQAMQAYSGGLYDQAAALMRPIAMPLMPYLDLPNTNAIAIVMAYADILRSGRKYDDAFAIYEKLKVLPKSPTTLRASILSAQCLASTGKLEAAQKALDANEPIKRENELFPVDRMVRAQVHLLNKEYQTSIDEIAQVIACSRIDSEWYPESLYITAQCYEGLGAMTNIVSSVGGSNTFNEVSLTIYKELTKNFPKSTWAQKSKPKVVVPVSTNATDGAENKSKETKP